MANPLPVAKYGVSKKGFFVGLVAYTCLSSHLQM